MSEVCDGEIGCPGGDDETFCGMLIIPIYGTDIRKLVLACGMPIIPIYKSLSLVRVQ